MVRLSLAVLALSVTSAIARPTHLRRNKVCHSSIASAVSSSLASSSTTTSDPIVTPTSLPNNVVVTESTSEDEEESTSKSSTKSSTKSATESAVPSSTVSDKKTSTTSVDASETSSASGDDTVGAPSGASDRVRALMPVGGLKSVVSFSDAIDGHKPLSAIPVSGQAKTSKYDVGVYEGRTAMRTLMTKGSIAPGSGISGGMSFYSFAPELQAPSASEYLFSYSVWFDAGFDFNKGGKLLGLFGGTNQEVARTCSGGRHDPNCWSMRLMWRAGGAAEVYAYLPAPTSATKSYNKNNQKCGKAANGPCESEYGNSMARGTWTWKTGAWTTVSQRIKLNTVGQADGEVEMWVDGKSVVTIGGLVYRTSNDCKAWGRQMQTFFGGHTSDWASPKNQYIMFADMTTSVLS